MWRRRREFIRRGRRIVCERERGREREREREGKEVREEKCRRGERFIS
jgi:hypothetical protein